MKLYTDMSQTAKMIEMGFENPKSVSRCEMDLDMQIIPYRDYSIGELLSFLPKEIDCKDVQNELYILVNQDGWNVEYTDLLEELYSIYRSELIDAIFDMCVKLKEEGVI